MDAAVLVGLAQGDEAAIAQVMAEYQRPLTGFSYRILRNRADAEEVVQDVWVRLWGARISAESSDTLRHWLFSTTSHVCIDRLRLPLARKRAFAQVPVELAEKVPDPEGVEDVAVRHWEHGHLREGVGEALSRLTENQRTVLLEYHFHERPYQEIARRFGIPLNTVRSRLSLARERLREALLRSLPDYVA